MALHTLSSQQLFNMFVSGGNFVIENRNDLNRINVFPVPDGDTGTNLASTFHSIIENGQVHRSAGKTMQSIAEQALVGARGNSGIIFAQFLETMSREIGDAETITVDAFTAAAKKAVRQAWEAVSNPVEGTMLSVIRDWADTVFSEARRLTDFHDLFHRSVQICKKMLAETTNKLKELRDAHVVDAGARGFLHFLQGSLEFIKTGRVVYSEAARVDLDEDIHEEIAGDAEIPFRYCTEALIKGEGIDEHRLKEEIGPFGDSIIVAGSRSTARIHVHTNRPAELFELLTTYGSIAQQKADDMIRQQQVAHNRKYSIALVTDSICDLPQEIIDRYQIHTVPVNITIGEAEYLDKLTMTPGRFYDVLRSARTYPTTSQPNARAFRELYTYLAAHYESIIAIHVSAKLSGTWSISSTEAGKLRDTRITVIDSKHVSGSLGLVVLRAAEEIATGRSYDQIVRTVESFLPKADNFVSVQTLAYMVRGGRVSPLRGVLARVLNLKPIVSMDKEGSSVLYGKAFSRRSNKKKIIDMVCRIHEEHPLRSYAVVHAHAEERAREFAEELEKRIGMPPLYITDISPVVALNAGLGALSVVTMKE